MPPHPYIAAQMDRLASQPALSSGTPDQARAAFSAGSANLGAPAPMACRRDVAIPTRHGTVPGRWLTPENATRGVILYLHGGGWVLGDLDGFEVMCRRLAQLSRTKVLMLDYRLAPEHPFPAGLTDVQDALTDLARQSNEPVVVAGDSAGANLATVAARSLAGALAGQVLFYPVVGSDFGTASYLRYATGWPLSRQDMRWFFSNYATADQWSDPDVAPLRAAEQTGLPPTFITTAEYDVLQSEGLAYARALAENGIEMTLHEAAGMAHGFLRQHNFVPEADATLALAARAIQRMLSVE